MKYGNLNLGQIEALVNKLGGMEAVERILREEVKISLTGEDQFTITIDYTRSLEDMIAAGHYDWKNTDITSKNFPITGTGQAEVKLHLVHLNREATTAEVAARLDSLGFQSASIEHLLAFGEKYPDKQREFPIVALGSVWVSGYGDRYSPCLNGSGAERDLGLFWLDPDDRWDGSCRFLAVSK